MLEGQTGALDTALAGGAQLIAASGQEAAGRIYGRYAAGMREATAKTAAALANLKALNALDPAFDKVFENLIERRKLIFDADGTAAIAAIQAKVNATRLHPRPLRHRHRRRTGGHRSQQVRKAAEALEKVLGLGSPPSSMIWPGPPPIPPIAAPMRMPGKPPPPPSPS